MTGNKIFIGEVFFDLTIVKEEKSYISKNNNKLSYRKMWRVKCKCGKEFITSGTKLRRHD
jgi:hypothetical protein